MKKSVALGILLILLLLPMAFASTKQYARSVGANRTSYVGSAISGAQALDLPPPPAPPGSSSAEASQPTPIPPATQPTVSAPPPAPVPTPTSQSADLLAAAQAQNADLTGRVSALESQMSVVKLVPQFEDRLNKAEAQAAQASTVGARVDALQSQVDAFKVDMDNFRQVASRPYVDRPTFDTSLSAITDPLHRNIVISLVLSVFVLFLIIGVISMRIISQRSATAENKELVQQYLVNYRNAGYPLETLRMHLRACGWNDQFIEEAINALPTALAK